MIAAELTAAAVRGCERGRVACAARHFPGLGAASQDTDRGAGDGQPRPGDARRAATSPPFEAAFAEGVPAVVLSHAFYAAYDPVTPAALSRPVATDLLRDELGFEGVAITDDLGAGAIKATGSVPDAAVAALHAGADMVQIASPDDQDGVADGAHRGGRARRDPRGPARRGGRAGARAEAERLGLLADLTARGVMAASHTVAASAAIYRRRFA